MPEDKDREIEGAGTDEVKERARAAAEARVAEIKRKKELAKQAGQEDTATTAADAKSSAEARVREIKRRKELAKQGDGEGTAEDKKAAAEARVAEIKRKRAAAKQEQDEPESDVGEDAKSAAEERVREIKRRREAAKQAGSGGDGAKLSAEERVRELKRKKELAKLAAGEAVAETAMSEREKKIAAMKAKVRAKGAEKAEPGGTPGAEASPNQPLLEKYVKVIKEQVGKDALEEAYVNRLAKDVPTVVVRPEVWGRVAEVLKGHEALAFDYLADLHGGDYETHMEVYVHLYSFGNRQPIALKAKLKDRENPVIDSLATLWNGADWPERETYDLLGIRFKGHPNLKRIMMPDDWVGHPLRKDYEPYDVEV